MISRNYSGKISFITFFPIFTNIFTNAPGLDNQLRTTSFNNPIIKTENRNLQLSKILFLMFLFSVSLTTAYKVDVAQFYSTWNFRRIKVKKVKYTDIAVRSLTCHTATGTDMPYRMGVQSEPCFQRH